MCVLLSRPPIWRPSVSRCHAEPRDKPDPDLSPGPLVQQPEDVVKAGGPPNVTPFNGEHDAGVQVLNTGEFAPTDGPLKRVTTSGN